MPAPHLDGDGGFSSPGQKSIPLPSFYSPRTSASGPDIDSDLNGTFSLKNGETDPVTGRPQKQAESAAESHPDASAIPPSLLSPAPSSPLDLAEDGTGTSRPEKHSHARPEQQTATEPRGVPVDSSDPSGGCGSQKPHLLETLPKVECIVRARIPTVTGNQMFLHLYSNNVDNKEHLAIVFGEQIRSKSLDAPRPGETERDRMTRGAYTGVLYPGRTSSGMAGSTAAQASVSSMPASESNSPPLVRVHSECYTGETVWSARCDCGEQLDEAARLMSLPGNKSGGVIIYLRQEGRGIGLGEKLKAYNLQDLGSDTVEANLLLRHPADARSYGLATAMLLDLGQQEIRLLTNNPDKIRAVEGPNREIVVRERVPMVPLSWRGQGGFRSQEVDGYLSTKRDDLPEIKVVFVFAVNNGTTIANLLAQVNNTIPLETADRGLGDYVVGLGASPHDSFEFLHFQKAKDLLNRDDEILIRSLSSQDIANRQVSGRLQRREDGDYILDGVSLGDSQLLSFMRQPQLPSSLKKKITNKANGIQRNIARINGPPESYQLLANSPFQSTARAASRSQQQAFACQANGDGHAGEIAGSEIVDASHGTLYHETGLSETPGGGNLLDWHGEEPLSTNGHMEIDGLRANGQGQETVPLSASIATDHQPDEAPVNDSILAVLNGSANPSTSLDPTASSKITALVLHNGAALDKTEGPANPDDGDTSSIRPGEGKTKTKKRNARRRARRAMEKAREEGKAQAPLEESAADSLQANRATSNVVSAAQQPKPATSNTFSLRGKLLQETAKLDKASISTQNRQRSPSSSSVSSSSISSSSSSSESESESLMEAPLSDKNTNNESWAAKINYRAVECCDQGRLLGTPPFPFVQNWGAANGMDGKLSQKQQQKRKAQDACVSSAEPHPETAQKRRKLSSDDGTPVQHPPSSADAATSLPQADAIDLPPLPANLATLPQLHQGEATVGMAITWKKWVLSQKTGWEPKVVDVRAQVVAVGAEGAELEVRLPPQDRDIEKRVKRYDMVTGERIYDRFEGPDEEDEDEDEDEDACTDGETTIVSFSDMLEPRMLKASAA